MSYNKPISDTTLRVGPVRFSYAHVFEKRTKPDGTPGNYGCTIIIPKTDKEAIKLIENAIEAAKLKGKDAKWGGKIPTMLKTPLRDGDDEKPDDPAFENAMFLNASSNNKPDVWVNEGGVKGEALGPEDFYSGCIGAAVLAFFPYSANGNRGIGAGLNACIKTEDGEKLSGGISAKAAFADMDE